MATISSVNDNELIQGTPGEDNSLEAWGFRSTAVGSDGNDTLQIGTYMGVGMGGDGDDVIFALRSYQTVYGGNGHDIIDVNTNSWHENIANVSVYGGEGNDAFIFRVDYTQNTRDDGSTYNLWRCILDSTIMDFNPDEVDYIILQNIGPNDYARAEAYDLLLHRNTDGYLVFTDFDERIKFRLDGITRFSDIADAGIGFNDVDTGDRVANRTFKNAVPFVDMGEGVKMSNAMLILESTIEGDIQISDAAFWYIDAVEDSVPGRALVGNNFDNWIWAGDYGNKMWCKGGSDNYMIGGAGNDTFYAGQGEGTVRIYHCTDDDVVKLWNVNAEDLASVSYDTFAGYEPTDAGSYRNVNIMTKDETLIQVVRPDDANSLTVQLADGGTFRFHYDDNYWEAVDYEYIAPLELEESTDGLMIFMNTAVIGSSYEGDVRLSDFDDSIDNISAVNDTVEGRVIIGDTDTNVLRAGWGGASMYGGGAGADSLYGGAGNDTFAMGKTDGVTSIIDASAKDLIYLYDATFDDINSLSKFNGSVRRNLNIVLGVPSITGFVNVWSALEDESTSFLLADGSTLRYYNPDTAWQLSTDGENWQTITEVNGLPVGMSTLQSTVYISSDYTDTVFALDDWDNDALRHIDATADDMVGRTLIGDTLDNSIRAGSGGAWLYGGEGGNDTLYGGDGSDTYQAKLKEGNLRVTDYRSDDVILFSDFNFTDLTDLYVERNEYNIFVLGHADETNFYFEVQTPTASLQTVYFQFEDGSGLRYDSSGNVWQRSTDDADTWNTITEVNGSPVGTFVNTDGVVYVMPDYVGDFSLEDYADGSYPSVTGYYVNNESRKFSGNELDNRVRGSNYVGSWLYGAEGEDTLVGGGGVDTFEARQGEGYTHIVDYSSDDLVYLSNVNFSDLKYLARYTDDTYWCPLIQTNDDTTFEIWSTTIDDTVTTILLADSTLRHDVSANVWQRSTNGSSWSEVASVNGNPVGIFNHDGVLFLYGDYQGDFSLVDFDGEFASVSADRDTLHGRKLFGDANDNRVRASRAAGSYMWGGEGGEDTLIGGEGDDTFQAGMGEGNTHISLAASNDLIYLWNVNGADVKFIANTLDEEGDRVTRITTSDDTGISVTSSLDETSTTVLLADNTTLRYADGAWSSSVLPNGTPVGIETVSYGVNVFSDFQGGFSLSDLNDSSLTLVNATNDTVKGRVLVGDAQDNWIYAGDAGNLLYGSEGDDTLIGGNGNDTFRAGMGEGSALIGNCGTNDLVDLWNINFEEVSALQVQVSSSYRHVGITASDTSYIEVWTPIDDDITKFKFADGSGLRYNAVENAWERNVIGDVWSTIGSVYDGTPVGIFKYNGVLYVYSDYAGDVILDDLNDGTLTDVYAVNDTLSGRIIVGDANDNVIYAGSGGASLFGGGGDDVFVGGAGNDTFRAEHGMGTTEIIGCADDDVILLSNVSSADVLSDNVIDMTPYETDSGTMIAVSMNDSIFCSSWYSEGVTATTFEFSDGIRFQYDYNDKEWKAVYDAAEMPADELSSLMDMGLNEISTAGIEEDRFNALVEPQNDSSSLIMKCAALRRHFRTDNTERY